MVTERKVSSGESARLHPSHGSLSTHLATSGNYLLRTYPEDWKGKLKGVRRLTGQEQSALWEGRAMVGGRLSEGYPERGANDRGYQEISADSSEPGRRELNGEKESGA